MQALEISGSFEVLLHFCNKSVHYRYPHDEPHADSPSRKTKILATTQRGEKK
jgi:hypothetical protein